MEGITNYIFRKVYLRHFRGIDLSYTPFIVANQTYSFKTKEKHEMMPYNDNTVPQILSNNPDAFVWAAREMKKLGYNEVNLNLGCPSPTVSGRGRGAGMLKDTEMLKTFLDKVFSEGDMPGISVKTRVGVEDPAEVIALVKLYLRYPFEKIIVHPRLLTDLYKGNVRMDCFRSFYESFETDKLVFNGDILNVEDAAKIAREFPGIDSIMIGRGLLADPFLSEKIKGDLSGSGDVSRIRLFLNDLWTEYSAVLSGDADVLCRMKEIWSYLYRSFDDGENVLKNVRKSRTAADYRNAVKHIC